MKPTLLYWVPNQPRPYAATGQARLFLLALMQATPDGLPALGQPYALAQYDLKPLSIASVPTPYGLRLRLSTPIVRLEETLL